jgi:uncharacterized membrane protein YdjX (TVP38/TMEM64 family)
MAARAPLRAGLVVVALFALATLALQRHAEPLRQLVAGHLVAGVLVFVATSALAVVVPLASNLPLVPVATLAWGPAWTAVLLLTGWTAGAALSFALGRHARPWVLQRLPSVQRHADIDRWIDPRHRLFSLVALRATFPVDVLSYALGLFSARTTAVENALSTLIGAAPFAALFASVPVLPLAVQGAVLALSVLLFLAYVRWVTQRHPAPPP